MTTDMSSIRIELTVEGVTLPEWAARQQLRRPREEARDDLARAIAAAAEAMLHTMGFADAVVRW